MHNTLLFGFRIIISWKSYDLLKMDYGRIFSDIIQFYLLTGQHFDVITLCSPSRLNPCIIILLSEQLGMNTLNRYFYSDEPFSVTHNCSEKMIIAKTNEAVSK